MLYVRFHDAPTCYFFQHKEESFQILYKLGEIVPCDLSSSQTFLWLVVALGNGNYPVPCFLRAQLQSKVFSIAKIDVADQGHKTYVLSNHQFMDSSFSQKIFISADWLIHKIVT